MPHECTTCGRTFEDGSKEMLSGCPDCGGNKFQFHPSGSSTPSTDAGPAAGGPEPDSSFTFGSTPSGERDSDADSTGDARDQPSEDDHVQPREDRAQASARSAVVSDDELPGDVPAADDGPSDAEGGDDPDSTDAERPELSELREELNEQFESIKIHRRGEYELNLMELYDREERIIALEEDGRYAIDVPSSWREADDE